MGTYLCSETLKTQTLTSECSNYILETKYETAYKVIFAIFNGWYLIANIGWYISLCVRDDIPEENSFCYCIYSKIKNRIRRNIIVQAPATISTISVVVSPSTVSIDLESGIMDECIVCYENKKITEFIDISCKHKLCKMCNSRLETRKCPMCRGDI